jgi:hypothetical protein
MHLLYTLCVYKFRPFKKDECLICNNAVNAQLPCGHEFCRECIDHWITESKRQIVQSAFGNALHNFMPSLFHPDIHVGTAEALFYPLCPECRQAFERSEIQTV